MTPSVVEALRPRRARALLSVADVVPEALRAVPGLELGAMGAGVETAQVVLAVLPWRWAPVAVTLSAPDGAVGIRDDPACVTVLRACCAMPEDGVATIVVGLGFLARRGGATVGANLARFGVHLTGVDALPTRLFLPASAPGRLLLTLRRRPPPCRDARGSRRSW